VGPPGDIAGGRQVYSEAMSRLDVSTPGYGVGLVPRLSRYFRSLVSLCWRGSVKPVIRDIKARTRRVLGIEQLEERVQALSQHVSPVAATWAMMSWIEHAVFAETPLVSVIMPTRNRSQLLPRAVDALRAQAYPHWELIVVDDGSTDDTPQRLEQLRHALGEERLQAIRIEPSGVCAARNRGLAAARGSLIAYADDDNFMHPLWLKAVAWAFSQRPDVDVVYGGFIVDDLLRVNQEGAGALPSYHLYSFNREKLARHNLCDIGGVAHRRGLPGAHFDESLREMGDWDLLVRLTRDKAPLVIPVIACFYSTNAPNRLSGGPTYEADKARVRAKAR